MRTSADRNGDVEERVRAIWSMVDFNRREWSVLAPLATAGFFEVYDVALLTLAAPVIAGGLGVPIALFGIGVALIRLATFGSLPLLRLADRWGRRTLLIASLGPVHARHRATALAWGFVAFVGLQMIARVFLSTESALSSLVVAEELRPDRRGTGCRRSGSSPGWATARSRGCCCWSPSPRSTGGSSTSWRSCRSPWPPYLRRQLPETRAFLTARAENRAADHAVAPRRPAPPAGASGRSSPIVAAFGFVQTSGFFYASELAQTDYGWSGLFTTLILASAVFGVLGYWLGGRIGDLVGRRPMIALSIVLGAAGTVLVFTQVPALFPPGFFLLAAAGSCFIAASLAYMAELFPTEVRASLCAFVLTCQVAAGSVGLVVPRRPRRRGQPLPPAADPGRLPDDRGAGAGGLPETACRDLVADRRPARSPRAPAPAPDPPAGACPRSGGPRPPACARCHR